ncbi:MAG TPA: uracil-DNA glycosylase [Acetobacteraceae bacterium]|nr:uracil-DNA glycosylase [Acetobacteraceae bacterium]
MDALALLRLQIEWGADEALEDAPVDRLRAGSQAAAQGQEARAGQAGVPAPSPRRAPPAPAALPTSATPTSRAAALAGQAQTLDALRAALAAFDGCALRDTAANLVFAAGNPESGLLLIGEPPGEAEDRSGLPFAGPDGALLDRMLASIALTRDNLLLTPMIPWRPPGGRPPNPAEIALCVPFLHRLIALVKPARMVIAGPLAARTLIGTPRRRSAPAWADIAVPGHPPPVPALAMPNPAMVARTPGARREAWAALRLLRRTLDADFAKT